MERNYFEMEFQQLPKFTSYFFKTVLLATPLNCLLLCFTDLRGSLDNQCKNKMFRFMPVITDILMKSPQILCTDFTVLYSSDLSHMLQPTDGQHNSFEFRTKQGTTMKLRRGPLFKKKPEALFIISVLCECNVVQPSRTELRA